MHDAQSPTRFCRLFSHGMSLSTLVALTLPMGINIQAVAADKTSGMQLAAGNNAPNSSTTKLNAVVSAASSPAMPASSTNAYLAATTSLGVPSTNTRVYSPVFLPKELKFTEAQAESITSAAAKQVILYHDALAQQNASSKDLYTSQSKLWLAKSEHDKWSYNHTQDVFKRHALYSNFIFWMVISIVASGLALTWYQFIKDSSTLARTLEPYLIGKSKNGPVERIDSATIAALIEALRTEHSLEVGRDGMKIKTRVVGLMTLVLSMGFFYLYLTHVYPVTIQDSLSKYQNASGGTTTAQKTVGNNEPDKAGSK